MPLRINTNSQRQRRGSFLLMALAKTCHCQTASFVSSNTAMVRREVKIIPMKSTFARIAPAFAVSDDDSSNSVRLAVDNLLQNALRRATRTMSTKGDYPLSTVTINSTNTTSNNNSSRNNNNIDKPLPSTSYLANPAVTPTALAHSQWKHIIRPLVDTAIDATCGNGNDSVAIASMLFSCNADEMAPQLSGTAFSQAQLICIDIQQQACETTREKLATILDPTVLQEQVSILHTSHSPLPQPHDNSSVALVCYNLGYLPSSPDRDTYTQMKTTIHSIADAALLLRVGGMLSIATYPRTNPNEDFAVHALLEGLALLTSQGVDWRAYIEELGPNPSTGSPDDEYSVRTAVQTALERIVMHGAKKQTWRVMEYKMLGRALAPVLLTAVRVK